MRRNRIVYFIIAAVLMAAGYVIRYMDQGPSMEGSFIFISMGVYFLAAVMFRKAAAWVLCIVDLIIMLGLQSMSRMNIDWYSTFYKSYIGNMIIGGPFTTRIIIYIVMGIALGTILEILIRQYNCIGMGD